MMMLGVIAKKRNWLNWLGEENTLNNNLEEFALVFFFFQKLNEWYHFEKNFSPWRYV